MSWLSALPTIIASAALLFGPGLLVGLLIRLRGVWLWAVAPLVSTTLFTSGSVVLPWLGFGWTPVSAITFAALFGTAVVALFRLLLRSDFQATNNVEPGTGCATAVGWLVAATVITVHFIRGINSPDAISQTFDNVFHLNAIALIGDTGNASPFEIARLTSPDGGQEFYPDGWHAMVQLAQQVTGASIPVAINSFNLVVAITVWPLGILLLSRLLVGQSRIVALSAGVLAAAFPAFPLNMLRYGVLYPYFFGLALSAVVLAVSLNLLGLTSEKRIAKVLPLTVLLAGLLPAVSLAHPGAMMAVLALIVVPVGIATIRGFVECSVPTRLLRFAGLACFGAVGFVMMLKLSPGDMWGTRMPLLGAVLQAFTLSLWGYGFPLLLAALVLAGLVFVALHRNPSTLTIASLWATSVTLFIVAAGVSNGTVRIPVKVWYGDAPRLAAIIPMATIPLIVYGVSMLFTRMTRAGKFVPGITAAAIAVLLIGSQALAGYPAFTKSMKKVHALTDKSLLLSTDEVMLLERLAKTVGPDEMIAGSPWTGTSLAFAISDRRVVFPHILMNDVSEDRLLVMEELQDATSNPEVCDAVNRLNLGYVLDFGPREVHRETHTFPGIDEPEKSSAFELVDAEGDAQLYRFIGCSE